ncbi:hypothetical protein PY650_14495 [Rhizobium calliandrae]|uniref:Recombinase domain-containing protein n=1 Tax=Rhizobium calliandrae TaxID=1312182 RepID=A0ABT7KFU1_9HYPH|nr:hypothetical protein [Rhizobium calliandrae]MDL2406848.1 hypothetical protein [Rhizobium calliandrae]
MRGDGKRQTGILHNELYVGRIVWKRTASMILASAEI